MDLITNLEFIAALAYGALVASQLALAVIGGLACWAVYKTDTVIVPGIAGFGCYCCGCQVCTCGEVCSCGSGYCVKCCKCG